MTSVVHERTAYERMTRTMYFAIGIAAIIFGALLSSGPSGFRGQFDQVDTPFLLFSIVIGIIVPGLFPLIGYLLPLSVMRGIVTAVAISFVSCQLLFPIALGGAVLESHGTPWLQGFGAIPATLVAVAWGGRITWIFALGQGPIVIGIGLLTRDDSLMACVLDGLGATVSCSIFAGVSAAVILAARRQDAVAEDARAQASLEAVAVTREREQTRINAMVHDDIMSVFLAASREPAPPGLAVQARAALTSVSGLGESDLATRHYAPEELIAVLRSTVGDAGAEIDFTPSVASAEPLPREVVAALAEATEEAIRNSILHAGDNTVRGVSAVVDAQGVTVVIDDNGKGFATRDVPQRRLGLRVSILERMRSLPGGDARVHSRPGAGTNIRLSWERQ